MGPADIGRAGADYETTFDLEAGWDGETRSLDRPWPRSSSSPFLRILAGKDGDGAAACYFRVPLCST